MAEKVTTMVLKVDLQCPSCRKKIRKVLAKFPQIRTQVYDEKQNTVTITVVCYSPENFRDKLCCKGGKTIKSIEIKEPPKPDETKKKGAADSDKKPKSDKPEAKPIDNPPAPKPTPTLALTPSQGPPVHVPALGWPPVFYPAPICCGTCYGCSHGGPCYMGHWGPTYCGQWYECGPGGPWYQGYRRPVPFYEYFNEENTSGCTVM